MLQPPCIHAALRATPKANIFGGGAGQIFITPRVKRIIDLANEEASRLKDEYISTEHIFLAILSERNTPAARILESAGRTSRYERGGMTATSVLGQARPFLKRLPMELADDLIRLCVRKRFAAGEVVLKLPAMVDQMADPVVKLYRQIMAKYDPSGRPTDVYNFYGMATAFTMVDVLNESTGMNNATKVKLKQFVLSGSYDSGFGLDLMVKENVTYFAGVPTMNASAASL